MFLNRRKIVSKRLALTIPVEFGTFQLASRRGQRVLTNRRSAYGGFPNRGCGRGNGKPARTPALLDATRGEMYAEGKSIGIRLEP